RQPAAATAATAGWAPRPIRMPAANGPTNAPTPSPVLHTVLAATSSPGVRAKAGISVTWVGRTGALAAAEMAPKTNNAAIVTSWSGSVCPAVAVVTAVIAARGGRRNRRRRP